MGRMLLKSADKCHLLWTCGWIMPNEKHSWQTRRRGCNIFAYGLKLGECDSPNRLSDLDWIVHFWSNSCRTEEDSVTRYTFGWVSVSIYACNNLFEVRFLYWPRSGTPIIVLKYSMFAKADLRVWPLPPLCSFGGWFAATRIGTARHASCIRVCLAPISGLFELSWLTHNCIHIGTIKFCRKAVKSVSFLMSSSSVGTDALSTILRHY